MCHAGKLDAFGSRIVGMSFHFRGFFSSGVGASCNSWFQDLGTIIVYSSLRWRRKQSGEKNSVAAISKQQ
jgi:hypothetical protein